MALDGVTPGIQSLLGLPWLRLAYSALLLAVAAAVLLELGRVWSPQPTQLGAFSYYLDGKTDDGRAQGMRAQVRHYHQYLLDLLRKEAARDDPGPGQEVGAVRAQVAVWSAGAGALGAASDKLADLELTLQGVNVSKIGSSLRRAVVAPDEITGVFSRADGAFVSTVSWPKAPTATGQGETYRFAGSTDDDVLAFDIACALLWTAATSREGNRVANVSQDELIAWMRALVPYVVIRDRRAANYAIGPEEQKRLTQARATLTELVANDVDFAEIYRLRASITRLLFRSETAEDRQATSDLIVYNALLDGRTLAEARAAAQAAEMQAPAPPPADRVSDLKDLLARVQTNATLFTADVQGLKTFAGAPGVDDVAVDAGDALDRLVSAVGLIRNRATSDPFSGTGFVIGPDVVATSTIVLASPPPVPGPIGSRQPVDFVLADRLGSARSVAYPATEVLRVIGNVTLLRVPGLPAAITPIAIAPPAPMGERVSVIAFAGLKGLRSTSLGAIVGRDGEQLTYDAATEAGSAGAPVLAADGRATALHFAGMLVGGEELGIGQILADTISAADAAELGIAAP